MDEQLVSDRNVSGEFIEHQQRFRDALWSVEPSQYERSQNFLFDYPRSQQFAITYVGK